MRREREPRLRDSLEPLFDIGESRIERSATVRVRSALIQNPLTLQFQSLTLALPVCLNGGGPPSKRRGVLAVSLSIGNLFFH
jgi:hypothetical protein